MVEDLLPRERLERIKAQLTREGRVAAADLARAFQTSEDTIRRDLRDLAAAGLCQRVYGGALRVSPGAGPLRQRLGERPDAKAALAAAAATLAADGQVLFIDTGSTNRAVAAALPREMPLTVITNAPGVAVALADHARCTLIMIGGRVDPATGGSFGARALRDLDGLRPDLCVLGTCACSSEGGLAVFDHEEAAFKRSLIETGARIAAAVTREKLSTTAPFGFAGLDAVDTLVIEAGAVLAGHERHPNLRLLEARALDPRS